MIVVLGSNIPTVICELYGRSRITTGLLIQYFWTIIRVPDDGTVTFYREIKFKMGFGVITLVSTGTEVESSFFTIPGQNISVGDEKMV